jgi:hypothetical protein
VLAAAPLGVCRVVVPATLRRPPAAREPLGLKQLKGASASVVADDARVGEGYEARQQAVVPVRRVAQLTPRLPDQLVDLAPGVHDGSVEAGTVTSLAA